MLKGLKSIEHIGIHSEDTKKLTDWYCDTLGLDVTFEMKKDQPEKSIYFLKGLDGTIIEILPSNENKIKRELNDSGFSHIGINVDNFKEVEEQLKARGVVFDNIRETSMGWTIGYFNDPDGNTLEIVYRPKGEKI